MRTYYVYGDYGYNSEQELYQSTDLEDARDFARDYTRYGNTGGYNQIEVAWFDDDGEYITDTRYFADDDCPELAGDGFDLYYYDDEPAYEYFSD